MRGAEVGGPQVGKWVSEKVSMSKPDRTSEAVRTPRDPWRDAEFTLHVKLPGEMSGIAYRLTIGEEMARCMRPLPPNREIPWEPRARLEADAMMSVRHMAAKTIAERLTQVLLEAFRAKDTVNGYPPEG